jgi:hypothetical protein
VVNLLIGIGGTGAKVVEAALTLFSAGLGPREIHVGLIDQDRANGNVNRTQSRLTNLQRFQRLWRRGGSSSWIDWTDGAGGGDSVDFGAVSVKQLFEDRALWCPEAGDLSLASILGQDLSQQQRDLFDLLFMANEHEQNLVLGEGYRGRAHVGAAALIAAMLDEDNDLIERITELMSAAHSGEEVRIFLVGSAFGGTGAAGFPTLARELNRVRTTSSFKNGNLVSIGGALMLPYFGFARPEKDGQPVVTTDELLPKARLALEYYGRLFETEQTFDRFYVLGWSPFFDLGYHEAGNYEQRNPPLVPELFAATAIIDFFGRDFADAKTDQVPVMLSARSQQGVRWSDFPLVNFEQKMGQLLRFSAYWTYVVEPLLAARGWFSGSNWTQALRGKLRAVDHEAELDALRRVTRDVLTWAATMQVMSKGGWVPGPWDAAHLLDSAHKPTKTEPVTIAAGLAAPERAFDELVRSDTGDPHPFGADQVYEALLTDASLSQGKHEGYGKVAAAAYRAVGRR